MMVDARGPRWGVALGVVLFAAGYFPLQRAYLAGPESAPAVAVLCLFSFFTGAGSASAFTASIKTGKEQVNQHVESSANYLSRIELSPFSRHCNGISTCSIRTQRFHFLYNWHVWSTRRHLQAATSACCRDCSTTYCILCISQRVSKRSIPPSPNTGASSSPQSFVRGQS